MNIMSTIIEVQAFGDFDMIYTECVMVSSEKYRVNEIMQEFYSIQGITSNKGLDCRILRSVTEDFISFLELKGFSKLKTSQIYFCD